MPQRQKPIDETPSPGYATPVIDMQDLEHHPTPQPRVPKKGTEKKGMDTTPRIDTSDLRNVGKSDEAVFKALEEFEKKIERKPTDWYIPPDVTNPF